MSLVRRRLLSQKTQSASQDPIIYTNYLTVEALEDGLTAQLSVNTCQYCIDGNGDWKSLAASTATPAVNKGQHISFRATGLTPTSSNGIGTFAFSKNCNLMGDVMSMLYGDDAPNQYSLAKNYAFYNLFYNNKTIIDASRLRLKATTLTQYCYYYMFNGCSNLVYAPEIEATTVALYCCYYMFYNCTKLLYGPSRLPAMVMKQRCYSCMFRGCNALISAPELPATTLADRCYSSMFLACSSLTTAPVLPAKTLATYCYQQMFYNCSKLSYIKAMFTDILDDTCLDRWCYKVASTGTFVKAADATWDVTGESGIPDGWTVKPGVEGYDNLEFVESDGTQQISVSLPSNFPVYAYVPVTIEAQATVKPDYMDTLICFNRYMGAAKGVALTYQSYDGWCYGSDIRDVSFGTSVGATDRLYISLVNNDCTINGITKTYVVTDGESRSDMIVVTLFHFKNYEGSGIKAKIFSMTIGGDKPAELYPMRRNSDNVVGLYDIINNLFHPLQSI